MKSIISILFLFLALTSYSQSPQGIPYQAVMRNADGSVMSSSVVNLTLKIHDASASGNIVYQETHALTSNAQGLVSCVVGNGTVVQGNFSNINWGNGAKFLQVMMGSTDIGTQQLMSVPYALHSNISENGFSSVSQSGDTLYLANGNFIIVPGISAANFSSTILGCTDNAACNYNSAATQNNNSCLYVGATCDDGNSNTTNDAINGSCVCAGTQTSGSGTGAQLLPGNATCATQNISVTGCDGQTSLTYNGRTYELVEIGGQCWFAENLATDKYLNGDYISVGFNTSQSQEFSGGRLLRDPINGAYSSSTFHLLFDANQDVLIDSVLVYAQFSGVRQFELVDNSGNQLDQIEANVPAGASYVKLNFFVPSGFGYSLRPISGSQPGLWRDGLGSTLNFPYNIGGLVTINTSTVAEPNSNNYYYYFYDWHISLPSVSTAGTTSVYSNDPANEMTYGRLYNWYSSIDERGLCPTGWHVPSDCEWMYLENSLGMSILDQQLTGNRGSNVGGKLKATTNWSVPNLGATNFSGFLALPGGSQGNAGFMGIGDYSAWWSVTDNYSNRAWCRSLSYNYSGSGRSSTYKQSALSVRCLRD